MREHLEYNDATDIDDLIADIHDLNGRLDRLRDDILNNRTDVEYLNTQKRSHQRLSDKRENLLRALNDALGYMRNE